MKQNRYKTGKFFDCKRRFVPPSRLFRVLPCGCATFRQPQDVTSAPSLTVFRKRIKTHFFSRSFT